MDSSAIWGNIAQVIVTKIARAIASAIWPIASAILSQLQIALVITCYIVAERLSYYVGKPKCKYKSEEAVKGWLHK